MTNSTAYLPILQDALGDKVQTNVPLKRYSVARIGGKADVMVVAENAEKLASIVHLLWSSEIPFIILGSGSNVLISDEGVRQVVVLNQARKITFESHEQSPTVMVESGVNFGALSRRAAAYGFSGLEWATGIPGTVGGAIYGNAGAHGQDMAGNLVMANILQHAPSKENDSQQILQEDWSAGRFEYAYRSSILKRQPGSIVVLSAILKLEMSTPELVQAKMDDYNKQRKISQPAGASLGSIFKNPDGDHAGRLIEAAGLKGRKIGKVEISQKHANFFIGQDGALASDYARLIKVAQDEVFEKSGIRLETEIELIGEWSGVKVN